MSGYEQLYRSAWQLAKELGKDLSQVPQPFQLNELENYYMALQAEAEQREASRAARTRRPTE